MQVLKLHTSSIYSLAFSPDGAIASSSADTTVKVTELSTAREIRWLLGSLSLCPLAYSPDGRFLARGGDRVVVWSLNHPELTPPIFTDPADAPPPADSSTVSIGSGRFTQAVQFSPDGRVLAANGPNRALRRWSIPSGEPLPGDWGGVRTFTRIPTGCLAYSPDGLLLATSFGVAGLDAFDPVIMLWDATTGELRGQLASDFYIAHPSAIAFSPDGAYLAGVYGPSLLLFDVVKQQLAAKVKPGTKHLKGLVFAGGGRKLVTVSNDKMARMWSVPGLREEQGFEWRIGKLTALAIAPDELRLAAGSDSGRVIVWDAEE
jgi:WD40 repeat protein